MASSRQLPASDLVHIGGRKGQRFFVIFKSEALRANQGRFPSKLFERVKNIVELFSDNADFLRADSFIKVVNTQGKKHLFQIVRVAQLSHLLVMVIAPATGSSSSATAISAAGRENE